VRAITFLLVSSNVTDDGGRGPPDIEILHPILYCRATWLAISYNLLLAFFMIISFKLGLNWTLPNILIG
jgi:hypothetical protein